MKRALLTLVVACGGAQPVAATAPASSDLHWLEGRWPGRYEMVVWRELGGVLWGIRLDSVSFEVSVIGGHPRVLDRYDYSSYGLLSRHFELTQQTDTRATFVDRMFTTTFSRSVPGWAGEDLVANTAHGPLTLMSHFDARAGDIPRVPAIEQADLDFAADTAKDGADGWARHFDAHGMMWHGGHRIWGDAITETMTKTLAAGALGWRAGDDLARAYATWRPVTSGARGNVGFSLGTAGFTEPGGKPERMTYCTIWLHESDGSWKVLFDIGRPAV